MRVKAHGHPLEILNDFLFESVFRKRNPVEPRSTYQGPGASAQARFPSHRLPASLGWALSHLFPRPYPVTAASSVICVGGIGEGRARM